MSKFESRGAWLESLQPGSQVLIFYSIQNSTISTVERLTKTRIITKGNRAFSRRLGKEVGMGGRWQGAFLHEVTPEVRKQFADQVRRRRFNSFVHNQGLTDKHIRAMLAAYDKVAAKEKGESA